VPRPACAIEADAGPTRYPTVAVPVGDVSLSEVIVSDRDIKL